MKPRAYLHTSSGGRERNEDCGAYRIRPWKYSVFAVADGLGGHGNGDVASSLAVEAVIDCFSQNPSLKPECIHDMMEKVNDTVCAAQGKAVSASLCSAATVGISQVLNTCFSVYFIPAANIMLALGISACANNTMHLDKAVKLIRKYLLIFLGGGALVYFTVLSVRTSVSSAVDESTVKTIKFASANFIPVIGGAIGDSAQAVAASLAVSKSTVGVFGLFCILAIFIPIISKILVWIIGLEICSLFSEAFSLEQETICLKHLADTLTVFIVVIIFCVTMFFINFGVLLTLRGAV